MMNKNYKDLIKFKTFDERFLYLKIEGAVVCQSTFGYDRYVNQYFYKSKEWKNIRDKVIVRDNGNDLGIEGEPIFGQIVVHHITPITLQDLEEYNENVFDMNNLICCSKETHNALHYGIGDSYLREIRETERTPQDNFPWRIGKEVN